MRKENIYIDLSKCSEEERNHIFSLLPKDDYKIDMQIVKNYKHLHLCEIGWFADIKPYSKTELTYPEFIKLLEGGAEEKNGWIDAREEQPLCVSTGNWDGKQSDIVLAETFTGKKFLAQCYEGFMDGSKFYDWYQVDEINSNDRLITESVSRWIKIPF